MAVLVALEVEELTPSAARHATSVVDFPPGLTASGGATIEVVDMPGDPRDFGEGIALGYLRDP
jgi:hypothetical protein